MSRPAAAPGLAATLRERVPARVAKRLEGGNPAEGWTWEAGKVTTDGGEVVSLPPEGPVGPDDLRCTCLLGPRCLHVLAVACALPGDDGAPVAPPPPPEPPPPPPEPVVALDGGQRAVTGAMTRAAGAVLFGGASGLGPTAQEALQRAAHGARATGLPRLGRAGARVLREVRDLQRGRPEFALEGLVDALREVLGVAQALADGTAGASWVGTARATYAPVGHLRLTGVCTEPVIAATGAGVLTWLADERGRTWSIANIQPGGPDRARSHYEAAAGTGGATLTHRELGRAGLFLQDATASSEGRIGTGGGVKAARAAGAAWISPPLDGLWTAPLEDRLRRGREGLLFVEGTLVGADRGAPVLVVDGWGPVRLVPPSDHVELAFRDNLALLARAAGLVARVVGRRTRRAGELAPIALGPAPGDAPGPTPPDELGGRINLGFDRMLASWLPGLADRPVEVELPPAPPDPLDPVRRRLARLALGGRRTLPGEARGEVEREARALRDALMPTGADALLGLAEATAPRAGDPEAVRRAWLAAAWYADTAATRLAE